MTLPKAGKGLQPDRTARFRSREALVTALTASCIAIHLIGRYLFHWQHPWHTVPLIVAMVAGGIPLIFDLVRRALHADFSSDLLAGLSITAAFVLGEYLAGSIIVLMLSGGGALEAFATARASAVLSALAGRLPHVAHQSTPHGIRDIPLDDIRVGDRVLVLPFEISPVDGTVAEGAGTMDESYLTGEAWPVKKVPGSDVISGTQNGESPLTISVTHLPHDSRYARIMQVMREAETHRPPMRRLADRLDHWYTIAGVTMALASWLLSHSADRFLAVIVIATPCPLILAIPVAIVGAISMAARRGIVIRNPAVLEQISSCRTVIFDKTGTLTYGKPVLTDIYCAPGIERSEALRLAASLEQYSTHPLAAGILERAQDEGIVPPQPSEVSEKPGQGMSGKVDGRLVHLTGRGEIWARYPEVGPMLPPEHSGAECILLVDRQYAATFAFHDVPREDSHRFVEDLNVHHQPARLMLISGDRESEVRYLAAVVGISEVFFGKSPEEKVSLVRNETAHAPTMFIGDGVNDAPAMRAATVGIAFGKTSDVTAEAADAVVLEPSFGKVDELIHIGIRLRRIALQSAGGGMALSIAGMFLAAAGHLTPVSGAIAQEVIDVLSIMNALRMVRYRSVGALQ
ncbi:MAG TPA: heavy metal translocating P-type ATPase [Bryobacteraceae bacterium]|nr:heavy metal translocating P-type ATPase [Bryobacteraceae bacterium]